MSTLSLNPRWPEQVCQWVLFGLLLLASWAAAAAEPPLMATPAIVDWDADAQMLEVTTIDHHWQLALQPKRLLGQSSALQHALFDLPTFHDGLVTGDPDSWVRITHEDAGVGKFTGHIFSRGALYELQYRRDMGGHALALLNIDITLEEIPLPPATPTDTSRQSPGTDGLTDNGSMRLSAKMQLSPAMIPTQTGVAARAIKIGIVVDSLYDEHHNGRGLAHALGLINGVDGLYQSQLGLAVVVESFRVYDDSLQDPLRNLKGTVEQILGNYREVRDSDTELPAELALVHLFSGHGDPQKVIGMGWIGTACRIDGYDLSISTPFPYDMLLSAHEIAHNLGAVHDDDAACNSDASVTGNEVMWSELSGSTRPTFSSCSLQKMSAVMGASCVTENIDVGVAVTAQATGNAFQQDITVTVFNRDLNRVAPQVTSITEFPQGTQLSVSPAGCSVRGAQLTCQHGVISADSFDVLSVTAELSADFANRITSGQPLPTISTELLHGAFTDTEQLNNHASVQLQLDEPVASVSITSSSSAAAADPATAPASGIDGRPMNDTSDPIGGSAGLAIGSSGPFSLLFGGLFTVLTTARRLRKATAPGSVIAFH